MQKWIRRLVPQARECQVWGRCTRPWLAYPGTKISMHVPLVYEAVSTVDLVVVHSTGPNCMDELLRYIIDECSWMTLTEGLNTCPPVTFETCTCSAHGGLLSPCRPVALSQGKSSGSWEVGLCAE